MGKFEEYQSQLDELNKQEVKIMTKLREEAQQYEPPKTKNIADLEAVSLEQEIYEEEAKDSEGTPFKYKYIVVDGENYRVPNSVFKQIQAILEEKPSLKTIKVKKKGEGLKTEYTVIQLE